jgi:hypothetical protein
MSPWWRKHLKRRTPHCARCNGIEDIHRGLCRACRARLLADETPGGKAVDLPPLEENPPPAPSLEPAHSRPWVHRGGG